MSTSATYRPIVLSAADLAAIKEQGRREKFRQEMIAALRQEVRGQTTQLGRAATVPVAMLARVSRQIDRAGTVEELRSIAVSVGRLSLGVAGGAAPVSPRSIAAPLASARSARPNARPPSAVPAGVPPAAGPPAVPNAVLANPQGEERAGLRFDLSRLELELASIERAAAELKVDLPDLDSARRQVSVASQLLDGADLRGAAQAIAAAQGVVVRLDEEIDRVLATAECRDKTIAAVRRTLAAMGFAAGHPVVSGEKTTVLAHGRNGRRAEVEVSMAAGQVELASTFTDPATAVASAHPHAGAVCEQAVLDQAEFHRGIQETSGLQPGRIRAVARPTRGAAEATSLGRARRHAASAHPDRERKAQ